MKKTDKFAIWSVGYIFMIIGFHLIPPIRPLEESSVIVMVLLIVTVLYVSVIYPIIILIGEE